MYVMVDVEADGPCPGENMYSMASFGAVVVDEKLDKTFYSDILKPISNKWNPEALSVSGISREEMETKGMHPAYIMKEFAEWLGSMSSLNKNKRLIFISDNNGFDWSFINYYFHAYYGSNPFGHSSQNLNSLYKGLNKDMFCSFKHLRKTYHSHNPVDDAKGNAEAMLEMKKMGLPFK